MFHSAKSFTGVMMLTVPPSPDLRGSGSPEISTPAYARVAQGNFLIRHTLSLKDEVAISQEHTVQRIHFVSHQFPLQDKDGGR